MQNWTDLNKRIARLDKRLDTLTAKPSRDRSSAEVGQISMLAKLKRTLIEDRKARRERYFRYLAQLGLDA